ncbi:ABC transporter substrate-binding protein [Kosmotoga pacifica]|uniref:ABC transporter substrate-binding protein n=1 Tax=Kosmotoga pacifica TaxID=1330330 RepID=A0A0G2Z730_9BACT|nr:ABC transporter substrate-binding protein [Kosmotoga pacifica]AKI97410.1 ABC transporter substrate-binding protein [Kosmotoga pacifica]
MRKVTLLLLGVLIIATMVISAPVLHMYTALDVNEAKIYIEAFEKATGIKVDWVRMSSGEVVARLTAERNNPRASIWFGGPAVDFIAAKKRGLLEPYKSPNAWSLDLTFKDYDGYWTGFYLGVIGFASNTEQLKELGVEAPTSWQDLLKPEFKGRISVAYPYTSGTSYTILAGLIALMGEDEAFDYYKKLDKQIHHYNKSGSACVTQVGLGEVTVGISFAHDIVKKGVSKGYPVKLTIPKEGTSYEIGAMAVVKGGPEPELAHKFIDWMLTAEAQSLMKNWFRVPLNPDAEVVEGAVRITDVNVIPLDFVYFGNAKDRIIERWKNEIQYGD